MKSRISIIVPVYADWNSLKKCITSLQKYYAGNDLVDIYFVNDCGPEADVLEKRILAKIQKSNNFHYHRNKENLGFVKNCNNAVFKVIADNKSDILLLNSDTVVTRNFLEEMSRILYSSDNIGIVNPRSNNATVWSVPMDSRFTLQPKKSYRLWKTINHQIPDKYVSSLCHGFCVLVRRQVVDKIKLFDEIYGKGYGEENDFAMRAYENGWMSASANRAFVFHLGSRSFGDGARNEQGERNMKILLKRYPDYLERVQKYISTTKEPYTVHSNTFLLKSAHLFAKSVEYGHYNGYGVMLKKGAGAVKSRVLPAKVENSSPRIHVWTHQVSFTGAPMVLFDILRAWKKAGLPENVTFHYPQGAFVDENLKLRLKNDGFEFDSANYVTAYFNPGDIVVLNSSAYPDWLFGKVIAKVKSGVIKHLFLYVHEDDDSMLGALNEHTGEFSELINQGLVTVYAPSKNSTKNWQVHFGLKKNIYPMSGHITYHNSMFAKKQPEDFNEVNFIIAGSSEPHKGQLSVLYAFIDFYHQYYLNNKEKYRDFSLTIAGIKKIEGGYYAAFIENASKSLGNKVALLYNPDIQQMHKAMSNCNFTITYSIKDSFSIVTMEGMAFGHPIIRSESSGREEQFNGKNGWAVDTTEWDKLVNVIEEVLSKNKVSNQKLADMSYESIKISEQNYKSNYKLLDDINDVLKQ
jgi:GT2 family glycosyltransferase